MKKFYFVIALMLLFSATSNAQWSVGIKGGLTIPSITNANDNNPLSKGYSSFVAFGGGVLVNYKFNDTWSLESGLEYSPQGGVKKGIQALPADEYYSQLQSTIKQTILSQYGSIMGTEAATALGEQTYTAVRGFLTDYMYADVKSTAKFHYLMLPVQVKAGWDIANSVRFYAKAGLFASYLMKAKRVMKTNANSKYYGSENGGTIVEYATSKGCQDATALGLISLFESGLNSSVSALNRTDKMTSSIHKCNFGFIGQVGFAYELTESQSIFIEGGGNYGFLVIQKESANGKNRIGSGSVMLGYTVAL